jgi:hypothetical protein
LTRRVVARVARVLVALAAASCGLASRAPRGTSACAARPPGDGAAASLLADPSFALAPWDAGEVARVCLSEAPWGRGTWGAEAASFRDADSEGSTDRTIDSAHLAVRDGTAALSARDASGRWSFTRFLQGDVWGGSSCGPVPWRRLGPVPLSGGRLALDFDVCLEESELGSIVGSWILVGANVWVSGPAMPARGRDRHGRKPLVLDLVVHHRTSMLGIDDGSHEDDLAYHYQVAVAEARPSRWTHVSIDLSRELQAAAERFSLEPFLEDLAIHQVELVVEVHDASAAARVDDVVLRRILTTP